MLDPRAWAHVLRLVHYYNYAHVTPLRTVQRGTGARFAPNVSVMNPERVSVGARTRVGARCSLWAGPTTGRIAIGADSTLGPDVFLTASNYRFDDPELGVLAQGTDEQDITVGDGVWLGTRVIVLAGVEVGDGCIVGAGSVVTRSLPAGTVAAGVPARALASRGASQQPPPPA